MGSSNEHTKKLSPPRRDHHRPPVIIYLTPPKVIHVEVRDFMTTVQLLTGRSSSSSPSPCSGEGVVGCNSRREVSKRIDREIELERNVEKDHKFPVSDDLSSSGPPLGPLPPPSSVSFFPAPDAHPHLYDFDITSGGYQDSNLGRNP